MDFTKETNSLCSHLGSYRFVIFFSRGKLKIARSAFRKIYKLLLQEHVFIRAVFKVYKGTRDQPMPNEVTKGDQNQNSPCNTNAF